MCRDSRLIAAPEFDHPNPVCVRTGCVLKEDGKPECAQGACAAYKPTPTPSITVGTQVRLTGVVGDKDGDKRIRVDFGEDAEDEWAWIPCKAKCLEVIRQPFKRGEVVYLSGWPTIETCPCRVLEDEHEGKVLLVGEVEGSSASYVEAGAYERRND